MKYTDWVWERKIEECDKLMEEVEILMDKREYKTLRLAVVCGADNGRGGIKGLKQNIRFLKKLKRDLIKFIKAIDGLMARYK